MQEKYQEGKICDRKKYEMTLLNKTRYKKTKIEHVKIIKIGR